MVHTWNSSYSGGDRGSRFEASLGKKLANSYLNKPDKVVHICNLSYKGGTSRIEDQGWPWAKTQHPIQNITKPKKGWMHGTNGIAPPSKQEALISNP
jgi:hypothetical protein